MLKFGLKVRNGHIKLSGKTVALLDNGLSPTGAMDDGIVASCPLLYRPHQHPTYKLINMCNGINIFSHVSVYF